LIDELTINFQPIIFDFGQHRKNETFIQPIPFLSLGCVSHVAAPYIAVQFIRLYAQGFIHIINKKLNSERFAQIQFY
jgi:hypothetical protein